MEEEEISDLVWLGRRLDNTLFFINKEAPHLSGKFSIIISDLFVPLIDSNITEEEEDYFFEYIDSILDDLEREFDISF